MPFILVADDNHDAADSLVEVLRAGGYEAVAVYDGAHAVRLCSERMPSAAILDVQMPIMDGCEAARLIRAMRARPNAIASLTAMHPREEPMLSKAALFDVNFRKPAQLPAIFAFVESSISLGDARH